MAQLFLLIKNDLSSYGALINEQAVPRPASWLIGVALAELRNPFDIVPDFVHVLVEGRIVKSGNKDLALELESKGYSWLED